VEEFPHMKAEEDPGWIESPVIKAEPVVSWARAFVCVSIVNAHFDILLISRISHISVCLSVCQHKTKK
jgi:hypothetical protein